MPASSGGGSEPEGRGFESRPRYKESPRKRGGFLVLASITNRSRVPDMSRNLARSHAAGPQVGGTGGSRSGFFHSLLLAARHRDRRTLGYGAEGRETEGHRYESCRARRKAPLRRGFLVAAGRSGAKWVPDGDRK